MPDSPYGPTLLSRTLAKFLASILASLCRSSAEATVVRPPSRINPQASQAVVGNGLQSRGVQGVWGPASMVQTTPAGAGQGTPRRFNRVFGFARAVFLHAALASSGAQTVRFAEQRVPAIFRARGVDAKSYPAAGRCPGHHAGGDGRRGRGDFGDKPSPDVSANQWFPAPENRLITATPAMISAIPTRAGLSSA